MKLKLVVVVVVCSILTYALWSRTGQSRKDLEPIPSSTLAANSAATSSKAQQLHLKRKIKATDFQAPLPAPKEWKLNYGDDDDEDDVHDNPELISGIKILSGAQATPSVGVAETLLVGFSPTPTLESITDQETSQSQQLFSDRELEQLRNQGADVSGTSGLIGGSRLDISDDLEDVDAQPTLSPDASPSPDERFSGQARGYTLLALMQPEARPMVERQLQILERARLKRAYLAVLADGTFGIDYAFLQQVVQRINNAGMDLVLGIFFSNGPAMRVEVERERYGDSVNRFEPEEFREQIKTNSELRQQFRELFQQARAVYNLNQSLSPGNANIAYVMLEDNLDASSYQALREIADGELSGLTNFIRNPCPGCWEGNDFDPGLDGLEFHLPEHMHALKAGDGYSMDGQSLFFPGEFDATGLSVDDAKTIISASMTQGVSYFALWRAARQGIYATERASPDQRVYEVPTDIHEQFEIELLRFGLVGGSDADADDPDDQDDTVQF